MVKIKNKIIIIYKSIITTCTCNIGFMQKFNAFEAFKYMKRVNDQIGHEFSQLYIYIYIIYNDKCLFVAYNGSVRSKWFKPLKKSSKTSALHASPSLSLKPKKFSAKLILYLKFHASL